MTPPTTFTARDGKTYHLWLTNSRTVVRDHDDLREGESLHEYWIGPSDDSARCYVAADGVRHTLD